MITRDDEIEDRAEFDDLLRRVNRFLETDSERVEFAKSILESCNVVIPLSPHIGKIDPIVSSIACLDDWSP
jgi:hypothetical protein